MRWVLAAYPAAHITNTRGFTPNVGDGCTKRSRMSTAQAHGGLLLARATGAPSVSGCARRQHKETSAGNVPECPRCKHTGLSSQRCRRVHAAYLGSHGASKRGFPPSPGDECTQYTRVDTVQAQKGFLQEMATGARSVPGCPRFKHTGVLSRRGPRVHAAYLGATVQVHRGFLPARATGARSVPGISRCKYTGVPPNAGDGCMLFYPGDHGARRHGWESFLLRRTTCARSVHGWPRGFSHKAG
ncbi:hypothetical protein CHS0354_021636 [Potamilus streckersoni]|uniref:Uncharacterized protein n=1 Tax=Potamilus streckersoni TaxID=2493646 RepID=A0AAE0W025_9BIVA|nr:hypothetical protein CHS0354_021636 [Potamilus streckersoni]